MTKKQIIAELNSEIKRRKEFYPKQVKMYIMPKEVSEMKIKAMETVLRIIEETPEQLVLDLPDQKPVIIENQIEMKL